MAKLDLKLARRLKEFLEKNRISARKIVIDIENETFEVESPMEVAGIPGNQHILDAMGTLSEKEVKKISGEIQKERDEEWD